MEDLGGKDGGGEGGVIGRERWRKVGREEWIDRWTDGGRALREEKGEEWGWMDIEDEGKEGVGSGVWREVGREREIKG
jgi:hypothetical protein